jgi:hypothetical protein
MNRGQRIASKLFSNLYSLLSLSQILGYSVFAGLGAILRFSVFIAKKIVR